MALFELRGIQKAFGEHEVLRGLDLDIRQGEFLTIIGESGCGKSLVLKSLIGIMTPDAGSLRFDGEEVAGYSDTQWTRLRPRIGMLFQWSSLMTLGIIFFAAALIFHLVTLPVEFNASSRAIAKLGEYGMLDRMEIGGAKKVLNAAALTYVGATAVAAMQLVQMLLIRDE